MDTVLAVLIACLFGLPHFLVLAYYAGCRLILNAEQSNHRVDHVASNGRPTGPPGENLMLFVIIPTYNEEATISTKLDSILRADYPLDRIDVVVVDGNSADQTVALAKRFAQEHPELSMVVIQQELRFGKSNAVQEALKLLHGDVAVITDADSVFLPGTLRAVADRISQPEVGAVTGLQGLRHENRPADRMEVEYSRFYSTLRLAESAIDSTPIFRGEVTAVRADIIRKIEYGKFAPLADDSDLAVQVRLLNWRSVVEPSAGFVELAPPTLWSRFKQKRRRGSGLIRLLSRTLPAVMGLERSTAYKLVFIANLLMVIAAPTTLGPFIIVAAYLTIAALGTWGFVILWALFAMSVIGLYAMRSPMASLIVGYLHSQVALLAAIPGAFSKRTTWSQIEEVRVRWQKTYGR